MNDSRITKRTQRVATIVAALFALTLTLSATPSQAKAAETAPATQILNSATAIYQDTSGNSFSTTSNTVSTTVQNAPTLTNVQQSSQNVSPGETVVDTYTLTNTGNAAGNFGVPADASVSSNASLLGYVVNGATTGTCSVATPCALGALQTALAALSATAVNGTITVGVEYKVGQTASTPGTVTTSLGATITYPTTPANCTSGQPGCAPAVTSATVTANDSDTLLPDGRFDMKKVATQPGSTGVPITWTITANDGGGFPAHDLKSAQTLLGAAAAGVLVTDKIPTFGGTPLGMTATPTVTLNGATSNATATLYYTTDATGATGWSTTYNASAAMIGVYVQGGTGGVEFPSNPSGSNGVGQVTNAQLTLAFNTNQPAGFGSGVSGSVSNIANSVIGGNIGATGLEPIVGPGVPGGTYDSASTSALTGSSGPLQNVTPSVGITPPGGASNIATSQAYASYTVLNGPIGLPGATGSYPAPPNNGAAAATTALDFTAVAFVCSNGAAINNGSFTCSVPTAGIAIPNAFQNLGNLTDTFTVTAQAPAGYTVQVFNATCPGGPYGFVLPTCTLGTQITGVSAAGGSISGSAGSVTSGTVVNYVAVYKNANAVSPWVAVDSDITVTGTQAETNDTHDDLYPGGAIKLTKVISILNAGCPSGGSSGPPTGMVCPSGTVQYGVAYNNVAPTTVAPGGSNAGTEPAWSLAGITSGAGTLQVTEDGANGGNNWATYTFGLNAAPVDTTGGTTYTYSPTSTFASGSYPNITPGPTKWVATIGGGSFKLQPGANGSITFNITVR